MGIQRSSTIWAACLAAALFAAAPAAAQKKGGTLRL
jgi:hypothetical protein